MAKITKINVIKFYQISIAMGCRILSICLKIYILQLFTEVKGSLPIVLREDNTYDLFDVLGLFSVILQQWNFYKVEFTYNSSAGKIARKIIKILRSFGF